MRSVQVDLMSGAFTNRDSADMYHDLLIRRKPGPIFNDRRAPERSLRVNRIHVLYESRVVPSDDTCANARIEHSEDRIRTELQNFPKCHNIIRVAVYQTSAPRPKQHHKKMRIGRFLACARSNAVSSVARENDPSQSVHIQLAQKRIRKETKH